MRGPHFCDATVELAPSVVAHCRRSIGHSGLHESMLGKTELAAETIMRLRVRVEWDWYVRANQGAGERID